MKRVKRQKRNERKVSERKDKKFVDSEVSSNKNQVPSFKKKCRFYLNKRKERK